MPKPEIKIDRVCRQILDRSGLEPDVIDHVASGPLMLRSALERARQSRSAERGIDAPYPYRSLVGRLAAFTAFLALSIFGYFAISSTILPESAREQNEISVPASVPAGARPITPSDGVVSEQTASRAPQIHKASIRERSPRKISVSRQAAALADVDAGTPAEFVSLGLRSTAEQASGGGRVVRVDLPAASLFAMGIDVPLENGAESVRADLIIGPDGVTRAVKLVE